MTHGDDPSWAAALALLRRRELTVAELERDLRGDGHDGDGLSDTLRRLIEAGYLDDERVALALVLRRSAQGRAPGRTDEELRRRGVAEAVIERAWDRARTDHDVDPGQALPHEMRRRTAGASLPLEPRAARRVYNALLRAGFEEEDVRSHLEPLLREPGDGSRPGFDDADAADPMETFDHTRADDDGQ